MLGAENNFFVESRVKQKNMKKINEFDDKMNFIYLCRVLFRYPLSYSIS